VSDTLTAEKSWAAIRGKAPAIFDVLDVREATRQDYLYRLGLFIEFINQHGLCRNSFLEFKRYLADRGDFCPATKNKYLVAARVFLKELNRQGMLAADITQNIHAFEQAKKHKCDGLNEREIRRLAATVRKMSPTPDALRLKALLCLMVLQGLRQIEVIRLDFSDVDLTNRQLFIRGKGRDDKEAVFLHPSSVKALGQYIKSSGLSSGPLFKSQSNNHRGGRLTARSLRFIIKKTFRRLGIYKNLHGLRHYFVTKLLRSYGGDILEVAKFSRHKGLEMLQVYNDALLMQKELPRYYRAFGGLSF